MATGGTLAPPTPGARQTAAAVALGAPKVASVRSQRVTAAKMPRVSREAVRMPKAPTNQKAAGRSSSAKQTAPKAPAAPKQSSAPGQLLIRPGQNSPQEIAQIARQEAQSVLKSELSPLKGEQREIGQGELGAAERYQSYSQTANNLLANLGQNQEASAKTFENQAADSALQAGKAVETAGQNQASMTGGYVSPELKAQLNAEANQAVGAGAAGNTFAQSSAQAGQNLMSGIRGAAALRAVEGQQKMTGYFQKQAAKVGEAENARVAKVGADEAKFNQSLSEENFRDYAAQQKLANEGIKLNVTAAADKSKAAHEEAENKKYAAEIPKINAEVPERQAQTAKTNSEISKQPFNEWAKRQEIAIKAANVGKPDATLNKVTTELGAAYAAIKAGRSGSVKQGYNELRNNLTTGKEVTQEKPTAKEAKEGKHGKLVKEAVPKVENQTLITAAFELWDAHKISMHTQQALEATGVKVPPEWINGQFKGF
jgi:hypothetical protein